MTISIVTIVYNDRDNIRKTIESVLSQTAVGRIEYIVVDGASDDGTSDIIRQYSDRIARYICEPDTGIYNAMNKGLSAASGDYVIFMNSGDCFDNSSVIMSVIVAIENNGRHPAVVYGHYREIADGHKSDCIPCRNADKIWYGPVASHQSTFYNLKFLRDNGLRYDESYRIAADYKLTLSTISRSAGNNLKLDSCISVFDTGGASNRNQDLGLKEANRARREVLHWGRCKTMMLTSVLLTARNMKKYMNPLYRRLRNR